MTITLRFSTIDGIRETRKYRTLAGAQRTAQKWIGSDAVFGSSYAVSADGVAKVSAEGCSLADLFSNPDQAANPNGNFFLVVDSTSGIEVSGWFPTRESAQQSIDLLGGYDLVIIEYNAQNNPVEAA